MVDLSGPLSRVMDDAEFVAAMVRGAHCFQQYRKRLPHIPYAYTRTRLLATPRFELVAMQWAPGAVSPIHDHGDSRCWVLLLEGSLDVENFLRNDEGEAPRIQRAEHLCLSADDLDHRLGPRELHRVHNLTSQNTYSLQLYATPIAKYSVFDERTNDRRSATATCDLELSLSDL